MSESESESTRTPSGLEYTDEAVGSGKEAAFAGCFRRIVQVMRGAQPANQWKFVFNTATNWRSRAYLDAIWPGDAYVDVVALDLYDQSWAANTYPYPSRCDAACRLAALVVACLRVAVGDTGVCIAAADGNAGLVRLRRDPGLPLGILRLPPLGNQEASQRARALRPRIGPVEPFGVERADLGEPAVDGLRDGLKLRDGQAELPPKAQVDPVDVDEDLSFGKDVHGRHRGWVPLFLHQMM